MIGPTDLKYIAVNIRIGGAQDVTAYNFYDVYQSLYREDKADFSSQTLARIYVTIRRHTAKEVFFRGLLSSGVNAR
jgi:hypothetical protein